MFLLHLGPVTLYFLLCIIAVKYDFTISKKNRRYCKIKIYIYFSKHLKQTMFLLITNI